MEMRPSRVLRKLRAGQIVTCAKVNTADARVVEIAAAAGFDCIWLCNEHVPTDWLQMENMVRAAKLHGADAMVRVSRGSYSDYIRPLEMDAAGLMVPHLMSAQQARDVVRMTKFHPVGRRPIDGGNLDGFFCKIDPVKYIEQANRERFVAVQIEDPEPLAELDEIAAVPGYDMLFFGPGDFSHGIGKLGQWDAPEIKAATIAVAEAAKRHGKFAGTVCAPANIPQMQDMGFQFLGLCADVIGLVQYFDDMMKAVLATGSIPKEGE
jgi:4-hydroxy-2-oxoheptanedioate aldolase